MAITKKSPVAPKRGKSAFATFRRMRSSVPGLDVLLGGGLPEGRAYLLRGGAGTGKTVLAAQLAFDLARAGSNSVFVTMLSEAHATLMQNLRTLSFFDEGLISERLTFVSGFQSLVEGGLPRLATLLRESIREHRARLLVVDHISAAVDVAEEPLDLKRFLRDLSTFGSFAGCTGLFIATGESPGPKRAFVETIADGVIELGRVASELRTQRTIEVLKLRGSGYLEGKHMTDITSDGLVIHPRVEARLCARPSTTPEPPTRARFGMRRLDEMLKGGLVVGSATGVLGASGAGKTLLGLQFLREGARRREPGLYFGFYEMPPRLLAKARGVGLPLDRPRGAIELIWQPPLELTLDAVAERLLDAVDRRNVRRLFIDGADALRTAALFPKRLPRFLAALMNELRLRQVTTIVSNEIEIFAPFVSSSKGNTSAAFDNLILLRYVELRSQLRRLLSIVKVHESDYDSSIREFSITSRGIVLSDTFESAEALLSGYARIPKAER